MESEVQIRLVLVDPPRDVDFGIQRGSGTDYESMFVQRRTRGDGFFEFPLTVSDNRRDRLPIFRSIRARPARR